MFAGLKRGLLAIALPALALVGVGAAIATSVSSSEWVADPDSQYLLDVNIRQLRLGDGVRAYETPEGACVVLGDIISTLDLPVTIDVAGGKLQGWAFKESNELAIDRKAASVRFAGKSERLAAGAIRDVPEGWCVETGALGNWLGLNIDSRLGASALLIKSEAKLPVEMAAERHRRAAQLKMKASVQLESLPQVKLPYRMWRRPALDFVVSGGATYRASTGLKVDRRAAVYAAGEVARLSYDAQFTTDDRGMPQAVRFKAFRSDPDGELLGPLKATHFAFGDVAGYSSKLAGSSASGRGAVLTNQPLFNPAAFDRTRFEGDLPAGWEAELYRNGALLAFAASSDSLRYVFDDVQLLYGDNQIDIVLYGPQGQIRTRTENVNVGQENVPPGKTWYWAGASQPGRDMLNFRKVARDPNVPKAQATLAVAHGIDQRTSVGVTVQAMQLEDERLTYVEGTLRRSVGRALIEVGVARDDKGGMAARAQALTKFGNINISAEALEARDFRVNGVRQHRYREARLNIDAPVKLGNTVMPIHGDVRYRDQGDGGRQLEAAMRLSANINRFNLSTGVQYRKHWNGGPSGGPDPPDEIEGALIGSGRIGDVRLRGGATFEIAPEKQLKTAEISAYWSASDKADFEGTLGYDVTSKLGRVSLTHIRRFDTMAVAVTGEAATDGSVAAGFNLNFSIDPSSRGIRLSRERLAQSGAVRATVYRDLNDNGRRDSGEPLEKGALITTGTRLSERMTDARGQVLVAGLTNYRPVAVGVDTSTLGDPTLAPKKALQVVTPRPGVAAEVEIGLVGAGDLEGTIVRDDGEGFEGLDIELIDESGKVIAVTRSDYDGFFMFERVAYGRYSVRLSADSARIANLHRDLSASASISGEAPVGRLGVIRAISQAQIAGNFRPSAPDKPTSP